jgi:hypothetical protein
MEGGVYEKYVTTPTFEAYTRRFNGLMGVDGSRVARTPFGPGAIVYSDIFIAA